MSTKFVDEMGKPVAVRGKFQMFKERDLHAIYHVSKEWDLDANDNIVEGDRDEALLIGYVADISNLGFAFDLAEMTMRTQAGEYDV